MPHHPKNEIFNHDKPRPALSLMVSLADLLPHTHSTFQRTFCSDLLRSPSLFALLLREIECCSSARREPDFSAPPGPLKKPGSVIQDFFVQDLKLVHLAPTKIAFTKRRTSALLPPSRSRQALTVKEGEEWVERSAPLGRGRPAQSPENSLERTLFRALCVPPPSPTGLRWRSSGARASDARPAARFLSTWRLAM